MDTARCSPASTPVQLGRVAGENAARDLLGLEGIRYTQPRYITCLDLGRSGAVIAHGWDRRVEKTGDEGKAVKRLINTRIIYPPADGTAEALLAGSSIDLAAQSPPDRWDEGCLIRIESR